MVVLFNSVTLACQGIGRVRRNFGLKRELFAGKIGIGSIRGLRDGDARVLVGKCVYFIIGLLREMNISGDRSVRIVDAEEAGDHEVQHNVQYFDRGSGHVGYVSKVNAEDECKFFKDEGCKFGGLCLKKHVLFAGKCYGCGREGHRLKECTIGSKFKQPFKDLVFFKEEKVDSEQAFKPNSKGSRSKGHAPVAKSVKHECKGGDMVFAAFGDKAKSFHPGR